MTALAPAKCGYLISTFHAALGIETWIAKFLCDFCKLIGTSEPGRWNSYFNLILHMLADLGWVLLSETVPAGLAEKSKTGQSAPKVLDAPWGGSQFSLV
jgi:hypothetical protein